MLNRSGFLKKERMGLFQRKELCCGACMDICLKKAIIMVKDCEGFRYPRVNGQI
jgi:hypothetical protein